MREPWIGRALDLYGHTEGHLGIDSLTMPAIVTDALAVIGDAVFYKIEQRAKKAAK